VGVIAGATTPSGRPPQSWTTLLALYGTVSFVEAIGVSQVAAFLPLQLGGMGVPVTEIGQLVGLLTACQFLLGVPLVPVWGVLADKYSRKAVIIRSALVEAVVFCGLALSTTPWQVAGSLLLVGFQLGNSGVMLAALRDVTPTGRLGTAVALYGASQAIGFAVGPTLGGIMIDGLGLSLQAVFGLSSALSVAMAVLLAVASREIRPSVIPRGSLRVLAADAVRAVFSDRSTRRLFAVLGLALLARQMVGPFLPLLVVEIAGTGPGLATTVGFVVGGAALVGALVSPLSGALGDRIGFRPVLAVALGAAAIMLLLMPLSPSVGALAALVAGFAAFSAATSAMVFGLVSVETPSERRSATLNLVYTPLYVAGIIGPAVGAAAAGITIGAVFVAGAIITAVATMVVLAWMRSRVAVSFLRR
jgi:DHA1 family multidrug resistance protein-like MFS transporter